MTKGTTIAAFLAGCAAAATGDARNSRADGEGIEWGEEIAECVENEGASPSATVTLDFAPFMAAVATSRDGGSRWTTLAMDLVETPEGVSVVVSCDSGTTHLRVRWIEP